MGHLVRMHIGRGNAVIILALLALSMLPRVTFAQTSPDPTPTTGPTTTPSPTLGRAYSTQRLVVAERQLEKREAAPRSGGGAVAGAVRGVLGEPTGSVVGVRRRVVT